MKRHSLLVSRIINSVLQRSDLTRLHFYHENASCSDGIHTEHQCNKLYPEDKRWVKPTVINHTFHALFYQTFKSDLLIERYTSHFYLQIYCVVLLCFYSSPERTNQHKTLTTERDFQANYSHFNLQSASLKGHNPKGVWSVQFGEVWGVELMCWARVFKLSSCKAQRGIHIFKKIC